jgi:fused signal recognition particle receptor
VAREELPLPEEVNEPEGAAQEWQPEQEPVDEDAPISDEELEAQALAADAAEEALVVVPVDEPQKRLLKRPLLNKRNRPKKVSSRDSNAAC